jgi:hypothetical protein
MILFQIYTYGADEIKGCSQSQIKSKMAAISKNALLKPYDRWGTL